MTCSKQRFASRAAVREWRRYQNRNGARTSGAASVKNGHAYRCEICGAWHWTSISKSEARRRGYR